MLCREKANDIPIKSEFISATLWADVINCTVSIIDCFSICRDDTSRCGYRIIAGTSSSTFDAEGLGERLLVNGI